MSGPFERVGIRPLPPAPPPPRQRRGWPVCSAVILAAVVLICLGSGLLPGGDPAYMDLQNCGVPPSARFWFGTDAMGRDVFAMIWAGGRVSLFIGAVSAAASTAIGVAVGAAAGWAPGWVDGLLMRLTEILLSVPSLLLVVLLQAALGRPGPLSLALALGAVGWTGIAKVVRTEVRQMRRCGYIQAAKSMGGGFFYLLRRHMAPNFFPSILFMIVMNVRNAIAAEATLSFMGLGLPPEAVTWGAMLSLAEKAALGGAWWAVLAPGIFLAAVLLSMTSLGERLRGRAGQGEGNL